MTPTPPLTASRVSDAELQRADEDLARLNFKLGNANRALIRSKAQHEADEQLRDELQRLVLEAQDALSDLTKTYHDQRRAAKIEGPLASGGYVASGSISLAGERTGGESLVPRGGRTLTDEERAEAQRQQDETGRAQEPPPGPKDGDTERVRVEDKPVDKPQEARPRVTFRDYKQATEFGILGDFYEQGGMVWKLCGDGDASTITAWVIQPAGVELAPDYAADKPEAEKATASARRPDDGVPEVDMGVLDEATTAGAKRLPDVSSADATGWGNERWRLADGRLGGDELPF